MMHKQTSICILNTHFLIWLKFGNSNTQITLLNTCDFREIRRRRDRIFCMDVSEITFTYVPWYRKTVCK